jgi:hypothetical protein
VRNDVSFAEILDAHLGCTDVPPPAARAWTSRPVTAPLFAFELPLTTARPAPTAPRPEPPPPVTPRRRLTTVEQQAVDALNTLGAGLDDALTPAALRRAFRALAHRYHPDRHPGRSSAEHERLARLFAEATAHYRLLAAALDGRTH